MQDPSFHIDPSLLSRLKKGDEQAFTDIYNQYWQKLYALSYKHLKSSMASEEIVQEVFLTLWNKRDQLEIASLPVYLAAMTRYAVYRYVAREKKIAERNRKAYREGKAPAGIEEEIDNKILLEIIGRLSNILPEKCRLVFIYNKLLDIPLSDVADQLNISPKTAEAHLTKALKNIRKNLGDAMSVLFI